MAPLARPLARTASWRTFFYGTDGNAAIIFALSLIVILIAAGGAVDYARAYNAHKALQASIDSSVLAGAGAGYSATTAQAVFDAQHTSMEHIAFEGTIGVPVYGTAADGSFTGTVTAQVTTYFLKVIGMPTLTVTASAAAGTKSDSNVCILLLDTSQTGLSVNGGTINAPDCEIDVKSTTNTAAMLNVALSVKKICIAGTSVTQNGAPPGGYPNVSTGCAAASDPYAGTLPTPDTACTVSSAATINGNYNMSPGVYCADMYFRHSAKVTFQGGIYVIKSGTWYFDGGTYNGSGVTFYVMGSNPFAFNGATNVTLSAPTSGIYSGILIYEPVGLSRSSWYFSSPAIYDLSGLVYLPSRQVTFQNGSLASTSKVTMVFDTMMLNPPTNLSFTNSAMGISGSGGTAAYLKR